LGFGSEFVGLVVDGLQGGGQPRLNQSKISSDKKIGALSSHFCSLPAPKSASGPQQIRSLSLPAQHKLKQLRRALRKLVDLRVRGEVEDDNACVNVSLVGVDAEYCVYFYGFDPADIEPVFTGEGVGLGYAYARWNEMGEFERVEGKGGRT
jgi:hypothetical protein